MQTFKLEILKQIDTKIATILKRTEESMIDPPKVKEAMNLLFETPKKQRLDLATTELLARIGFNHLRELKSSIHQENFEMELWTKFKLKFYILWEKTDSEFLEEIHAIVIELFESKAEPTVDFFYGQDLRNMLVLTLDKTLDGHPLEEIWKNKRKKLFSDFGIQNYKW